MKELSELFSIENLAKLFGLIKESPISIILFVIGILLFLITGLFAYKVIKLKPEETTIWHKFLIFVTLTGGVIFSSGGLGLSLLEVSHDRYRGFQSARIDPNKALSHLEQNSMVVWLIRLIAYNPNRQPNLALDKLTHLGHESQLYTFVAPYDELRGYTVEDAVRKFGGLLDRPSHVSAILFPLPSHDIKLIPANARGLLQIVKKIDESKDPAAAGYKPFDFSQLSKDQHDDLGKTHRESWSWNEYGKFYKSYCKLAQSIRCDKSQYTAIAQIGQINGDWHPLGLSQQLPSEFNPCSDDATKKQCEIDKWEDTQDLRETFGTRVFFIKNMVLSDIPGRVLIDFDQPVSQVIPDLGVSNTQ